MHVRRPARHSGILAVAGLAVAALLGLVPSSVSAQAGRKTTSFAQRLVEVARAKYPEADEIGILVATPKGCFGIASTDKSDVGEKCEADDIGPMETGKPTVGKEGSGFDVSVLLHDEAGKTVGVLAIGFKGAPGRTGASVKEIAERMEADMAARIPSKERLLEGWR